MSHPRVSLTNHLATATVLAVTSQQASWPASFALQPQRRELRMRTTATTQQTLDLDLGSAKLNEMFLIINPNFTVAQLFIDNASTFAAPDYSSGSLLIAQNRWNQRYAHGHLIMPPQMKQYVRFRIPAQATTDGAAYFSFALWCGPQEEIPVDIRLDEAITMAREEATVTTMGGAEQVLELGPPYTVIEAQRFAETADRSPGYGDELGAWLELDSRMDNTGFWGFWLDRGSSAEAWIMRRRNRPQWRVGAPQATDAWQLREVWGP